VLVVIIMTGGEPMPAEKVSMRQIREILRLKYGGRHTDRAIARSIGVAPLRRERWCRGVRECASPACSRTRTQ